MSNPQSPIGNGDQPTVVQGDVTGFEQGIAALAGLFTAGPLGALASWAAIKGVQGKWAPWFILGIPSAIAINAFYFGMFLLFGNALNSVADRQNPAQESTIRQDSYNRELNPSQATSGPPNPGSTSSEGAEISSIEVSAPEGLKIATAVVTYNDGDVLSGKFRIYCPTSQIRPTDYILKTASGVTKKSGAWWDESFAPKYEAERELVSKVCGR